MVAPEVPVRVQVTPPPVLVGSGPPGDGFTVAVITNVSPRLGEAGEVENVIVGVAGPTVTLAGGELAATKM